MRQTGMSPAVEAWSTYRTISAPGWSPYRLLRAKGETAVSVVIPARNEEATVGAIVTAIRSAFVRSIPLVDEVIVVDSRSADGTATVARAAGAFVVSQEEMTRGLPPMHGKGDALWAGLASASGDIVAFVDADVDPFDPRFVSGLLSPLLTDPSISFVKGFYHRPLTFSGHSEPDGGGRVTELVARPLLNLFWPGLAGFVQPLAGEFAARREVLERVPFVSGYGVEIAMLVDLLELVGLDALAQVDLGSARTATRAPRRSAGWPRRFSSPPGRGWCGRPGPTAPSRCRARLSSSGERVSSRCPTWSARLSSPTSPSTSGRH